MSSVVDAIKDKVSIVDVVAQYLKLEKAGKNFKARCPFHNEKTASFFVSPERGSYYCFGCNSKGDIFTFVEEFEGLDFRGALQVLARKAGVELKRENPAAREERERLFKCLEDAADNFEKTLGNAHEAFKYLKKRGLSDSTIKSFRLGYAIPSFDLLYRFLQKKGFSDKEIETAGLIKQMTRGFMDRFRGRIIFPLTDSSGRVIGFSGRIFPETEKDAPKYLNSPETPLFRKGEFLFGFDKAKFDIRRLDYTVVVEGQMDLVMSHQIGITNAVASSGTAITEGQLLTLKRFSDRIIFALDADSAGFRSSIRTAGIALSLDMEVKVADLLEGKDPADLALNDPAALKNALRGAKHIIEFYLGRLRRKVSGREFLLSVEREVLPFVKALRSKILQEHYVKVIAKETGASETAVVEELSKAKLPDEAVSHETAEKPKAKGLHRKDHIVSRLFGLLFSREGSKEIFPELSFLEGEVGRILGEEGFSRTREELSPRREELVFEVEVHYHNHSDLTSEVKEMLLSLEREVVRESFSAAMRELSVAERSGDSDTAKKHLKICQELSERISKLSLQTRK